VTGALEGAGALQRWESPALHDALARSNVKACTKLVRSVLWFYS